MVKYANWDVAVRVFEDHGGADPMWSYWCSRRGPKEAARRQQSHPAVRMSTDLNGGLVMGVIADLRSMADWYLALPEREQVKLPRMTFHEAKRASEEWHRRQAVCFAVTDEGIVTCAPNGAYWEATRSSRPVFALAPAIGEGDHYPVPGLLDHYWCRLETEDAYRQESARMSNCVGWASTSYRERYLGKAFPEGIWSLRRGDESLVTAEVGRPPVARTWSPEDGDTHGGYAIGRDGTLVRIVPLPEEGPLTLIQVRAAHNDPVSPALAGAVAWLRGFLATTSEARAA